MAHVRRHAGIRGDRWAFASELGRATVERCPTLYLALSLRRNPRHSLVKARTDLVVEGFPRCGNTLLVEWIKQANPHLSIASHLHSFAHVKVALRRHVPVIVVIRTPEDAVASEIVRASVSGGTTIPSHLLWRYERFYRALTERADDVLISPFATTTTAPERVVAALCERTGLRLELTPRLGMDEVVEQVEKRSVAVVGRLDERAVARPSPERAALAERFKAELRERHPARLEYLREMHDSLSKSACAVPDGPDGRGGDSAEPAVSGLTPPPLRDSDENRRP
jgi:hypothetical protein